MIKPVLNLAAVIVILFAYASVSAVPQGPVIARKEVKVYFYHEPGEYIDLAPVTRSVNAVRINFISNRRWPGWPGDLAPVRFKTAVELTLKQFPSVQWVIVSLNGDKNFASERGA
ncbi:MAG TPA: hypothetical protein VLB46_20085 [Pyrinomonadaceae bacterium]|nr:hypothetical protein [Pyrinomonadaceae bacterium]